jgi:hypothetical protein
MVRHPVALLALAATAGCAAAPGQASVASPGRACRPLTVDTTSWREYVSPEFGLRFLAPVNYTPKTWDYRSDPLDDKLYWRPPSTLDWWIALGTVRPVAPWPADSALSHYECTTAISGRPGYVILQRAGSTVGLRGSWVPYHAFARWTLPDGRALVLSSSGRDSAGQEVLYGIIQSLRFRASAPFEIKQN